MWVSLFSCKHRRTYVYLLHLCEGCIEWRDPKNHGFKGEGGGTTTRLSRGIFGRRAAASPILSWSDLPGYKLSIENGEELIIENHAP